MTRLRKLPQESHIEMEFRQSRLLHEFMRQAWGADFVSPIEQELTRKGFKVLDVGCGGAGTWLLQLSKDYPLAKFVGADKIPIFPKDFSQDNLQFIQGDILKGLPFEDNFFDFVHMGFILLEFTEEQWEDKVIQELVRVCKPGGWIEFLDIDEVSHLSPTTKRLISTVGSNLESKGFDLTLQCDDVFELFNAADEICAVYGDERLTPMGDWGGDLGRLTLELFINVLRINNSVKWLRVSNREYEKMIEQIEKEVEYYHSYATSRRICCQKNI